MTTPHVIEIETLDLSLQDIIEAAHNEPLVLTREGKPVYVVRSLLEDDLADDLIALHPDFIDFDQASTSAEGNRRYENAG
jgi:hypothetical protein